MPETMLESVPNVDAPFLRWLEDRADVADGAERIAVLAPFTEEVIGSVPGATVEDVKIAVGRARQAQKTWAMWSAAERAAILSRFHDLLIDRADIAMDLIQLEGGKSRVPALEEVYDTVATTRYYIKTGPRLLRRKRRQVSLPGFTTAYEYHHPIGVVGNITPWNFPLTISISDIVAALIAGNAVVIKPDEHTPYSALFGAALLEEAGMPEGVVQVLPGHGEVAGSAIVDEVDFVTFTGSTQVGRVVHEHVGRRLISASMELGGKNAAIVMADANLDRAIPGIGRAVYANGGQLCISMERIYVDEAIREEFTARFIEHSRSLSMSTKFDFSSNLSSLQSRSHLENVHDHVEDAVSNGATLLTGGKPRPDVGPLFYEPTVLTDVEESMLLCRAETFGPVVSIYGYNDIEDAIVRSNDSELGLNFSVWTSDTGKGVAIASRLHAGTVGVNDGYAAAWSSYDAPLGGMKASGISRRHGAIGLLKYTETQTVAVQRFIPAFAPPPGVDYPTYQRLLRLLLRILKRLPFYK
jgi:succinate-semialdehyde dehydrogenase/glutarate-semialdehyde dehydrogenase